MKTYYINDNGIQKGPYSLEELKNLKIQKDTLVWFDGIENWTSAGEIDELKDIILRLPPPINVVGNTKKNKVKSRTKMSTRVSYIIGILLILIIGTYWGYVQYEKRKFAEINRLEKLEDLKFQYKLISNELQKERNKLEEINEFKFLRTAEEKEEEVNAQVNVISELEIELQRIQSEINSFQ